jgi:AraC-like DNA-binding protein
MKIIAAYGEDDKLVFLRYEGKEVIVNYCGTDDDFFLQMSQVNRFPLHLMVDCATNTFIIFPHFTVNSKGIWTFSFNPSFKISEVRTGDIYYCTSLLREAIRFISENVPRRIEAIAQNILREGLAIAGLSGRFKTPDELFLQGLHLAKKIIEENVEEAISVRMLCQKTGLNEFKLKKGFRSLFQITVMEYHLQLKMEHAKKLLLESDQPISHIAFTIGYEFAHNFSREFKGRFGCSPGGYRRMGRG